MEILHKKCRTTGKKALAYRGKGGQNTGTAFPALRLGVVLYLLISGVKIDSKRPSSKALNGPLNQLNAILSLLQPLDRKRTRSAIGSAIGRALSRPISHPRTGGSSQLPLSKPLRGLNCAIAVLECLKPL